MSEPHLHTAIVATNVFLTSLNNVGNVCDAAVRRHSGGLQSPLEAWWTSWEHSSLFLPGSDTLTDISSALIYELE